MLGVKREGRGYRPVAICDWCNEVIEEGKQGNYLWEVDKQAEPTGTVAFTGTTSKDRDHIVAVSMSDKTLIGRP